MTLKKLKQELAVGNLTVKQLCKICGVSSRTIYYWLAGTQKMADKYLRLIDLTLTIKN